MDGVQAANSGHPGMPMGMADVSAVLWLKYLKQSPAQPHWADRDRFVLSAGHGSMLLYSLLHLAGYKLPLEELKRFRQLGSLTPGHPEYGHTDGVETTTGPLSQGLANAVGMALAEQMMAARFNTPEARLVDHYTYVISGDGCLMEGLSHEACSLAGHLKIGKLILFYDSNRITIEGSTSLAYSDNVRQRFESYGWHVLEMDGHNLEEIDRTIAAARAVTDRPVIIITHTHIAQGAPKLHDSHKAHGEPLGADEIKATKEALAMPAEAFHVPESVRALFAARAREMQSACAAWEQRRTAAFAAHPELAASWESCQKQELPADLGAKLAALCDAKPVATRAASGKMIQTLAAELPWLVGGSADLAPSTKTLMEKQASVKPGEFAGRNLHFGIREHAMAAIMNGMTLHGGFRVYGATFFVFSDYCRPSVRLAAIMSLPVIYVFTHDSFYVGEDGPTHEPVEQTASFRCMPNVSVIRPADATETAAAWLAALRHATGPTLLLLTRQNLPVLDRTQFPPAAMLEKGAYTLWQSAPGVPETILIASGSEVSLALEAAKLLAADTRVRVVSMPSWDIFERQSADYKSEVLPPACTRRLSIEAGCTFGWERYTGTRGKQLGLDHFGLSGPYEKLAEKFGFTVANVVKVAKTL